MVGWKTVPHGICKWPLCDRAQLWIFYLNIFRSPNAKMTPAHTFWSYSNVSWKSSGKTAPSWHCSWNLHLPGVPRLGFLGLCKARAWIDDPVGSTQDNNSNILYSPFEIIAINAGNFLEDFLTSVPGTAVELRSRKLRSEIGSKPGLTIQSPEIGENLKWRRKK